MDNIVRVEHLLQDSNNLFDSLKTVILHKNFNQFLFILGKLYDKLAFY